MALVFLLPPTRITGKSARLPYRWQLYFICHLLTTLLTQISTLIAIRVFSSPISVALLTVPKGLLVTLAISGILQGHARDAQPINQLNGSGQEQSDTIPFTSPHSATGERASSSSALHFSPKAIRYLSLASFAPIVYWFVSRVATSPLDLDKGVETRSPTVDIVISYFDEDTSLVHKFIDDLRNYPWIKDRDPRVIVYSKALTENVTYTDAALMEALGADEVYHMVNKGRETGTYIRHILNKYNASTALGPALTHRSAGLADHTLFMQPHLASASIARERILLFRPKTGYLNFGPYLKLDCGKDLNGNGELPRLREIYNIFAEELCPPTLQLGAYFSQFVVSKQRILANPYHKYKILADILEADADHWIYQEGLSWRWKGDPSNPYFGHAMERAWPIIFGCADPDMSDTCAGENYNLTGCQCCESPQLLQHQHMHMPTSTS
ncbi:hypothetical protein P389DRAFT_163718 [Cystobasidium minutum MCA 4210]|uniref:uncharacterized protein n=1 Tax=Cystobasidium minutum MCA 4210 TaxID=1397322 RepID=UPI0034CD7BC2|eukprot:jgi/Rhomi1/163718/estExt_Genewise1Plus.C_80344